MVYSLVVESDMQGRCGDYCGNMVNILPVGFRNSFFG